MKISSNKAVATAAILAITAAFWCGCHTVPQTGRKQVLVLPEAQEIAMGVSAYEETLATEPLSQNAALVEMVNRVGRRIASAADRPDYQWEFVVLQKDEPNVFCLPGGKVAVYEGILPICQTEAGLAVVMSHEVAHALARHGGERMSQGLISDSIEQVVRIGTADRSEADRAKVMQAYGAVSQYGVLLPYSREHESEADSIGLNLMAKAGYDPAEAPRFWQRFAAMHTTAQPIEFMSTHPSDMRRAEALEAQLSAAQELYAQASEQFGIGEQIPVTSLASHTAEQK